MVPCSPFAAATTGTAETRHVFVSRDREEELRDVARAIRARAAATDGVAARPTAIVFHRPLPYLYLAQQVLTDARVPYQAFDALPLAAEPYAALLDLVLASRAPAARAKRSSRCCDRRSLSLRRWTASASRLADVARSTRCWPSGAPRRGAIRISPKSTAYFGDATRAGRLRRGRAPARAARAAAAVAARARCRFATALGVGAGAAPSRRSCGATRRAAGATIRGAIGTSARARPSSACSTGSRTRSRATTTARGPTSTSPPRFVTRSKRRRSRRGAAQRGVHLVDAVAARFGEFDHVHLVGLVETDWPERPRRNIFYTSGLLKSLGWPQEADQARARAGGVPRSARCFRDETLRLHAFQLEGDAIVALSPMVELARGMSTVDAEPVDCAVASSPTRS